MHAPAAAFLTPTTLGGAHAVVNHAPTHTHRTPSRLRNGAPAAETPRLRRAAAIRMNTDLPPMQDLLSSSDALVRIRAIMRIDELPTTTERVAMLVALTRDTNQQVRYAAISRMSTFNADDVSATDGATILDAARFILANDTESSCRAGAADLIAGLRLSDGFDDLVDAYANTKDWMIKFSIAAGLGEMGDPRAFDFLTAMLEPGAESESLLLTAAIGSLGELGDSRGLPIVEKFLDHEDSSIRERATIARDRLKGAAPRS